jgi:flagellar hook assembly protein FlgD
MTRAPVKRWQILLKNSFGEVVRSYSGWDQPPLRLTWDGLDDAGRLVSDGRYYYEIVVVDHRNGSLEHSGSLTHVRTRGPQGRIEIRPGEE